MRAKCQTSIKEAPCDTPFFCTREAEREEQITVCGEWASSSDKGPEDSIRRNANVVRVVQPVDARGDFVQKC